MFVLFAQAAGNRADDFDDIPPEWLSVFLLTAGIGILVWLIAAIPVLLTLAKALRHCSPRKRTMEPQQVWLNLIPLFNLVWQFITVMRMAESLHREFRRRRLRIRDDFGQTIGLVACSTSLLMFCLGPVYVVCALIYWAKVAGYNRRMARDEEYKDNQGEESRKKDRRPAAAPPRSGDDDGSPSSGPFDDRDDPQSQL